MTQKRFLTSFLTFLTVCYQKGFHQPSDPGFNPNFVCFWDDFYYSKLEIYQGGLKIFMSFFLNMSEICPKNA